MFHFPTDTAHSLFKNIYPLSAAMIKTSFAAPKKVTRNELLPLLCIAYLHCTAIFVCIRSPVKQPLNGGVYIPAGLVQGATGRIANSLAELAMSQFQVFGQVVNYLCSVVRCPLTPAVIGQRVSLRNVSSRYFE